MMRVTKKSIAMTPTDPATTALVVDLPDALRAAGRAQPHVTGDADDDEPQHERFQQAHPDVLHVKGLQD